MFKMPQQRLESVILFIGYILEANIDNNYNII